MGISIEQWRSKIGCFSQQNKSKTRLKTLVVHLNAWLKSSLRVAVCLAAILIICGDVEQNPGPSECSTDGARSGAPSRIQASSNASNDPPRRVSIYACLPDLPIECRPFLDLKWQINVIKMVVLVLDLYLYSIQW